MIRFTVVNVNWESTVNVRGGNINIGTRYSTSVYFPISHRYFSTNLGSLVTLKKLKIVIQLVTAIKNIIHRFINFPKVPLSNGYMHQHNINNIVEIPYIDFLVKYSS